MTPPIHPQRNPVLTHHPRFAVTVQEPPVLNIQPQPAMGGAVVSGGEEHQAQVLGLFYPPPVA